MNTAKKIASKELGLSKKIVLLSPVEIPRDIPAIPILSRLMRYNITKNATLDFHLRWRFLFVSERTLYGGAAAKEVGVRLSSVWWTRGESNGGMDADEVTRKKEARKACFLFHSCRGVSGVILTKRGNMDRVGRTDVEVGRGKNDNFEIKGLFILGILI